jgi:hypothetical protein
LSPEQYAKIVAKRPELVVHDDSGNTLWPSGDDWWWEGRIAGAMKLVWRGYAIALIESHWLRMLPVGHSIIRTMGGWCVCDAGDGYQRGITPLHYEPIDALAEFYGGGD